ncbi:MAG: DUF4375 domain-containing protein [Planctomycetes bacterium]|nr:DUF4375 domain-containing protein [Planctomycetota bacterium]
MKRTRIALSVTVATLTLLDIAVSLVGFARGERTFSGRALGRWLFGASLSWLLWPKRPRHPFGTFAHWLTDRRHRARVAEVMELRERLIEEDRRHPPDCGALVDELLDGDDLIAGRRLKELLPRAEPALVAALDDRRCKPIDEDGEPYQLRDRDPWCRLVDLLAEIGSRAACTKVAPFLDHPRVHVRMCATRLCAASGDVAVTERVFHALDDDALEFDAVLGLTTAATERRMAPEWRDRCFERLLRKIDELEQGGDPWRHVHVRALFALDSDRAQRELTSPERFHPARRSFGRLLDGLRGVKAEIPAERLRAAVDAIEGTAAEGGSSHADVLEALIETRHPDAERFCERAMAAGPSLAATSAARWVGTLRGMADPVEVVLDRIKERGFESLSDAQRLFYAAWWLVHRVGNGGLANVYSNGRGREYPDRHRAFEAIGVPELAEIVREADRAFGPEGPPDDFDRREDVVGERWDELQATWRPLEQRFFAASEEAKFRAYRFALAHQGEFRAQAP